MPVTLDRPQLWEIKNNLDDFVAHWSTELEHWNQTNEKGVEKKYAQSFWAGLVRCYGIVAERMRLFEREAVRATTGNQGWIDFFMPSIAIGEAKAVGRDLDAAMGQIDDYLAGGSITNTMFPRWAMVTDFASFRIRKLDSSQDDVSFPLKDLVLHAEDFLFLLGDDVVTKQEEREASIVAARLMADLFVALTGDAEADTGIGEDAPETEDDEDERQRNASILMTRLLFLLYGDDAQLWARDLFFRWVDQETAPHTLGMQVSQLFQVLDTPEEKRPKHLSDLMATFPYVNGGIFSDLLPIAAFDFSPDVREALLNACRFNWNRISVAVFGAMFQLVKSKEARRGDGEHYTSETNIMKTIGPLFLDEFQERANKLIAAKSTAIKALEAFRDELATHVFCDPACGSGNFLVVAYRELRRIETSIIVEIRKRSGVEDMALDVSWEQKLSIDQFYGFELNWWPAKIAETAMFLVDHQANRQLAQAIGVAPDRLPIQITAHIRHGNALTLDWTAAIPSAEGDTYIFGNPPFIGARLMSKAQKVELNAVWNGVKGTNQLDYVTGWHAQAIDLLAKRPGQFAYVTTNSIVQGDQTAPLFGALFARGWRIKFAHRTFRWDSEAPGKAAVHCVIVGFTRDNEVKQRLWDYPDVKGIPVELPLSKGINAYLVDGANVLVESRSNLLSPTLTPAVFGSMPNDGGHLVPKAGTPQPLDDPTAMKYVRTFIGARELLHDTDRWCFWMADDDFHPKDLERSSILKNVVSAVRFHRESSERAATKKLASTPYLFGEIRQMDIEYVAIPRHVSENRHYWTVQRYPATCICGDTNMQVKDPDGLMFSLVSSSMFITWQRAVGGRIKSDLRFASTLTWNTFPVPELDPNKRRKIIEAGQRILDARSLRSEWSLADHYNPLAMSPELVNAHDALDREVDKAFGAPRKLTTERQRQELLFENYVRLTS